MRVRSNEESIKLANEGRGRLVPNFKYEPGYIYNLIPLTDSHGYQIMFQEKIHKLGFSRNGKQSFDTARCVKGFIDETPDPLDPSRPKNSGECPYCNAAFQYQKIAKAELEAWEKEHPDATDEEKKKAKQEINTKKVVNMFDTERYYLCAHLEADKLGKNFVMDDEGIPVIHLVLVKINSSQFDNKLTPRINDVKDVTGSGTLNYSHLRFKYPDGDKKTAAKNLDISLAPKGVLKIWEEHPEWKTAIEEKVKKLEAIPEQEGATEDDAPINHLDEKLYAFIPESELKIEKQLAPVTSQLKDDMTEEEKEALAKKIEEDTVTTAQVSAEDLAAKFNINTANASADSDTSTDSENQEGSFNVNE